MRASCDDLPAFQPLRLSISISAPSSWAKTEMFRLTSYMDVRGKSVVLVDKDLEPGADRLTVLRVLFYR